MPDPIEPFDLPVVPLPASLPWDDEEGALSHENNLLSRLRVASPCDASWDEMEGDEKVRFCRHCRKHVYNLSWMSRREAAAFVRQTEDRLRVRFYRRRDGTLLADNCPVGVRAAERRLLACVAGMGAVELSLSAVLTPALAPLMILAPLLVVGMWGLCAGRESGMGEPSPARAAPPSAPEGSRQTAPSDAPARRPRYRRPWHQRWGRGQWG
jgi:hypothetical protein